jgi:NAD(P)-dependent dehydrogenase (short-subunit alcohol dehydrogenase family)
MADAIPRRSTSQEGLRSHGAPWFYEDEAAGGRARVAIERDGDPLMETKSSSLRLLEGRVVIVTGGGKGIGRAIALALADAGARVVVAARERGAIGEVEAEIRSGGGDCLAVPTDVTRESEVRAMVEAVRARFGTIDVLVNNAGVGGPTANVEDMSVSDWEEVVRINLIGPFLCCRVIVPEMKQKRSGRIVNIGSITGKRPLAQRTPYCASKMGLLGFTRSLATELGPYNVTVNSVSPGATMGERLQSVISNAARAQSKTVEEVSRTFLASTPLGRFVEPQDTARVVVFLASDHAANITGEDVNVAAGLWMD